jgi:hypothetical protein
MNGLGQIPQPARTGNLRGNGQVCQVPEAKLSPQSLPKKRAPNQWAPLECWYLRWQAGLLALGMVDYTVDRVDIGEVLGQGRHCEAGHQGEND